MDFEARGNLPLADAGRIVADKIGPRLSPGRFILLERSQMARIRDEQDHQSSGPISLERQLAFGRAANVSHLVLGSVAQVEGITIDARLVEVATARVVRQASAGLDSFAELERALDELAAVLNADDQEYARIEESRLERQREARDVEPTVRPVGSYLEIKFRLAARGKSELSLIREARQRARDLYAEYCQQGSGRKMSRSELVEFCREHEQIEDVRTIGYKKEFVFLVPPPG